MPVQPVNLRRRCAASFAEVIPRRISGTCLCILTLLAGPFATAQANQDDARLNPQALTASNSATVSVRELAVPRAAKQAVDAATDAWQKQQWKKARAQATRALALYPGYGAALALLGYLDLQDGALEQA